MRCPERGPNATKYPYRAGQHGEPRSCNVLHGQLGTPSERRSRRRSDAAAKRIAPYFAQAFVGEVTEGRVAVPAQLHSSPIRVVLRNWKCAGARHIAA